MKNRLSSSGVKLPGINNFIKRYRFFTLSYYSPSSFVFLFYFITLFLFFSTKVQAQSYIANPQEFVGPFSTWINVKTKYGAKGDGSSDDTQALQRAFDELGRGGENESKVLYLPAGTYRITAGLTMSAKIYVSIIGEDPITTTIKWAGPTGGIMFTLNGVSYSRFNRITWDGSRTANTAVAHFWDGSTGYAVTHNEHADENFVDVGHGLRAGKPHAMDAETAVLRCRFIRNSIAGVSIESFNALDWYIWDSYFEDCQVGVTNNPPTGGAGNFHVFHSFFKRSIYADISMRNTMYFSVRDNYSIGSKAFFIGEPIGQNGGPITLQSNIILDPQDSAPIRLNNKGPLTLLDNIIRSRDAQTGPVVQVSGDLLTVGNTFTVGDAVYSTEKQIAIDNVVKSRINVNPSEPLLQATPRKQSRKVFELIPGWDYGQLQKTIDSAAAMRGQRPVIHLRAGAYSLTKTLFIPAGVDMQLMGDGFDARIDWRGAAGEDVLRLEGADNIVMEDFTIFGHYRSRGNGLVIRHSDQAGKQIFMEGVSVWDAKEGGVLMENFNFTKAELHNFNHKSNSESSIKVIGGKLNIFAGSSSDNNVSYEVTNGGSLMVQDIWYESGDQTNFVNLTGSGNFTLNGAKIYATATPDTPVKIDNFTGKATFLGVDMNGKFTVKGEDSNTMALALGMQFNTINAYNNSSTKAKAAMLNSRIYSGGSYPLSNIGITDAAFIKSMLEQVRRERPAYKNSSGLILHRIQVAQTNKGIHLLPATSTAPVSNQAPTVSITSPANNAGFTAPASVTMIATASDGDGSVSKVEFFNGSIKIGEDINGNDGWNYSWSNLPAGKYSISAKATDNKAASTISAPVTIIARTASTTAVVSFTLINATTKQPIAGFDPIANNTTIDLAKLPTQNLNIRANLNSSSVGSVRFTYNGNTSYAVENKATYDLAGDNGWTPAAGNHSLTATPYDASHATGSAGNALSINFSVIASTMPVSSCENMGGISREYWSNISGSSIATIPLSKTPSSLTKLTSFEAPSNVGDNYGQRIRGYVCPPVTGNYTFYIAGDDDSELYLSLDANASNKRMIASIDGWTRPRAWTKKPSQKSATYWLRVGEKYYIEALHKESGYNDNLAVAWVVPGSSAISVIPGVYLIPFASTYARIESSTAKQTLSSQPELNIFPNPNAGGEFYLHMSDLISEEELDISMVDISGRVVYSATIFMNGKHYRIKPSITFDAGMYILSVKSQKYHWNKRMVIK